MKQIDLVLVISILVIFEMYEIAVKQWKFHEFLSRILEYLISILLAHSFLDKNQGNMNIPNDLDVLGINAIPKVIRMVQENLSKIKYELKINKKKEELNWDDIEHLDSEIKEE